jgi:hypothetical protein
MVSIPTPAARATFPIVSAFIFVLSVNCFEEAYTQHHTTESRGTFEKCVAEETTRNLARSETVIDLLDSPQITG